MHLAFVPPDWKEVSVSDFVYVLAGFDWRRDSFGNGERYWVDRGSKREDIGTRQDGKCYLHPDRLKDLPDATSENIS